MCMYVCVYVCVCVHNCVCIYVCVHNYVCVREGERDRENIVTVCMQFVSHV